MIKRVNVLAWLFGITRYEKRDYKEYSYDLSTGYTVAIHEEIKRLGAKDAIIHPLNTETIRVKYVGVDDSILIATQSFRRKEIVCVTRVLA